MSYPHVAAPPHARPAAPVRQPGTLLALFVSSALTALSAITGAVLVFAGGAELAEENVRLAFDQLGPDLGLPDGMSIADVQELSGALWIGLIDDRASTLSARAVIAVFFALWVLVAALFARRAAVWARVLITVGAVFGLLIQLVIAGDIPPAGVGILAWLTLVTGATTLVLCWLPPNNQHARTLKAGR